MHTDQHKEMAKAGKQRQETKLIEQGITEGKPDPAAGKQYTTVEKARREGSLTNRNSEHRSSPAGKKADREDGSTGKRAKLEGSQIGKKEVHQDSSTDRKARLEGSPVGKKADHKDRSTGRKTRLEGSPVSRKAEYEACSKGSKAELVGSLIGRKTDHKGSPTGKKADHEGSPKHHVANKKRDARDHADHDKPDSKSDLNGSIDRRPVGNSSLKVKKYGTVGSSKAQHGSKDTPRQSNHAQCTPSRTSPRRSSNDSSSSRSSSSCSLTSSSEVPSCRKRRRSCIDSSSTGFRLRKRRSTHNSDRALHTCMDRHARCCYSSSSDSSSFTGSSSMTTSCSEASSYSSSGSLAAAYGIDASDKEEDGDPKYGSLNWYVKRTQGNMPAVSNKSMQLCYRWGDDSSISDKVNTTALICSTDIMSWHWSQSGATPLAC